MWNFEVSFSEELNVSRLFHFLRKPQTFKSMILTVSHITELIRVKRSLIFDSFGGLQMVIALSPVDIFQRNLFYYKISTNCSSDYES